MGCAIYNVAFGKSLSPLSGVAILALEKVETGREDRELKIADASVENVGNRQMSLMSEANTNGHNSTLRPHTLL